MELSVIVPAYNEEDTLGETVSKIDALLRSQNIGEYEIIVVNDGSVDATLEKVKTLAASLKRFRFISYPKNRGKGYALRQGFSAARGRLAAFIDADGEIDPAKLLPLLSCQHVTSASIVVGKKFVLGARPWHRRLMTWGFRWVGRMFFGLPVTDSQTGIKVLVREDVGAFVALCKETGYLFELELLALTHYQGISISEVPVEIHILRPSRITVFSGLASLGGVTKLFLRWAAYRRTARAGTNSRSLAMTKVQRFQPLPPLKTQEESYDARP